MKQIPGFSVFAAIIAALIGGLCAPLSMAAPAAGDTYVYRVINGYNNETVGYVRQALTPASNAQGQVVAVAVDNRALGLPRTDVYTGEGQWLRRPLDNHGMPVEYEFTPALPAVQSPLASGQSWSVRVNAMAGEVRRSVRVDGAVLGTERLRVPAGEFDTVKIRRTIYPGDAGDFKTETQIFEVDWYAPALGRSVRTETKSKWLQPCRRSVCEYRGDWFVYELTEAQAAAK